MHALWLLEEANDWNVQVEVANWWLNLLFIVCLFILGLLVFYWSKNGEVSKGFLANCIVRACGGRIDFSCVLNLIFGSYFEEKLMGNWTWKLYFVVLFFGV